MKEYIRRYFMLRRHNMKVAIKKAKMSKMCYAFLAPYAIIFALFYILPVITSIFYNVINLKAEDIYSEMD